MKVTLYKSTVIVDVMTEDHDSPTAMDAWKGIRACAKASRQLPRTKVVMVGTPIWGYLMPLLFLCPNLRFVRATGCVPMQASPEELGTNNALEGTSISVAMQVLAAHCKLQPHGAAVVSAGNTGAIQISGLSIRGIGRILSKVHPFITAILPTFSGERKTGYSLLTDAGANPRITPAEAIAYVAFGRVYLEFLGLPAKLVGLLNMGTEEWKGDEELKAVFVALQEYLGDDFVCNLEASDTPSGKAHIIVAPGYAGNVLLKGASAWCKALSSALKERIKRNVHPLVLAIFYLAGGKKVFDSLRRDFSGSSYPGAPIMNLAELAYKVHGSGSENDIVGTILMADKAVRDGLVTKFETAANDIKPLIRKLVQEARAKTG